MYVCMHACMYIRLYEYTYACMYLSGNRASAQLDFLEVHG